MNALSLSYAEFGATVRRVPGPPSVRLRLAAASPFLLSVVLHLSAVAAIFFAMSTSDDQAETAPIGVEVITLEAGEGRDPSPPVQAPSPTQAERTATPAEPTKSAVKPAKSAPTPLARETSTPNPVSTASPVGTVTSEVLKSPAATPNENSTSNTQTASAEPAAATDTNVAAAASGTSDSLQAAALAPAAGTPRSQPEAETYRNRLLILSPRFRGKPSSPNYPTRSVELGQQGIALIRALVGADGQPVEIEVWRSSGHVLLDNAALSAVRTWRFEPASTGGRSVEAWVQVPVQFKLN